MIHGVSKYSGANDQSATKAVEYFLSDKFYDRESKKWQFRKPAAELIIGNRELIQRLCQDCQFKNRYTTGVLSFSKEESDRLSAAPGKLEQILDEWKAFAFAGVKEDCRASIVVKHQHKERLELHYLIPRVHLESGKYFNPFAPNYTGRRGKGASSDFKKQNDSFVDFICKKYGLQNPRAPEVARSIKINEWDSQKILKQKIHTHFISAISSGSIGSRAEIVDALRQSGFEISRLNQESISVKEPGALKAFRLSGGIYADRKSFEELRATLEVSRDNRNFESIERDYREVLQTRESEVARRHKLKGATALRADKFERQAATNIGGYSEALESLRGDIPFFNACYDGVSSLLLEIDEPLNYGERDSSPDFKDRVQKFIKSRQDIELEKLSRLGLLGGRTEKQAELGQRLAKLVELVIRLILSLLTGKNHLREFKLGSGRRFDSVAKHLREMQKSLLQEAISLSVVQNQNVHDLSEAREFGFALKTKLKNGDKIDANHDVTTKEHTAAKIPSRNSPTI